MAQPSGRIPYDPLPLTGEDQQQTALYNAPASPGPQYSSFNNAPGAPYETSALPGGTPGPRFAAANLYDTPNSPSFRDSIHSQQSAAVGQASEYGSVYALNDSSRGYRDDPNGQYTENLPMSPVGHSRALDEKNATYAPPRAKSRRTVMIVGAIIALLLIIAAVVVPVYFTVLKPKSADSGDSKDGKGGSNKPSATPTSGPKTPQNVVSGGDGSIITMEDGTTFTYKNPFGGYWYYDPNDPFGAGGKAQSWTPAINETFNYGTDKIWGYVYFLGGCMTYTDCLATSVNLGGWLNTEPVRFLLLFPLRCATN